MDLRMVAAVAGLTAAGLAAAELVLRRRRPRTAHGRYADWVHPGGPLARPVQALANSRTVRAACEVLPVPPMVSDITDVVYVNYLVPATRLLPLVPPGLELQRVGPDADLAVFSFLAYRHGHLGPPALGRLRRLLPSPVQTNWRIYVHDPRTGHAGVHFVTTAVDHPAHALGGRLLCEALPMHLLRDAAVETPDDTTVTVRLDPGQGSAPDVSARLTFAPTPADGPWDAAFTSFKDMLAYVVRQDRALSVQEWHHRTTRQEIRLDIALDDCRPLTGPVRSAAALALVGNAEPFSFHVPAVRFRFDAETHETFPGTET